MPTLTLMCGAPGAGKSTWIRQHHPDAHVIGFDQLRRDRTIDGHAFMRSAISEVDRRLREGHDIIVDAASPHPRFRTGWLQQARRHQAHANLVIVDTPLTVCLQRQRSRQYPAPSHIIRDYHRRLHQQLGRILNAEHWDTAVVIAGSPHRCHLTPWCATPPTE